MKTIQALKNRYHDLAPPPTPHSVWTNPVHYITCVFGLGCIPFMPGTLATLLSLAICSLLQHVSVMHYMIIVAFMNIAGIWLCGKTNNDFGTHDHPATCFDELASFPICLIGIPFHWPYVLIAFILFRVLDIAKPEPIGYIDRHVEGGLGVMLDDVVAALITLGIMKIIIML